MYLNVCSAEYDDERFELESVSDDEADEADLGLESQHGAAAGAGGRNNNISRGGGQNNSTNNNQDESFNLRESISDVS